MNVDDLVQYFASNFWTLIVPVLVTAGILVLSYFSLKFELFKSKRSEELKIVIMVLLRGPVPVAVIGTSIIVIGTFRPSMYPSFFSGNLLIFLVQLLILVSSINAARKIGHIVISKLFKDGRISRRMFLIGLYSLGLVILFYVLLTSPLSLSFQQGALPVVSFITGLVITYLVAYIVNLIIARYQNTLQETRSPLNTTITFGRRVLIGVVILIGVAGTAFASFPEASGAVASLFVAAGFTSIVIGLAAQSSLSNLIAGGVISTSQPFRIGDGISYNNEYCTVEDIRLIFSILRTWDNRRLMVPNSLFLSSVIINYTAEDQSKISTIFIQITLESDVEKAMDIMKDVISKHPSFYPAEGLPAALIMGFTESGMQLRALGRARNQSDNWNLEKESLLEIKKEFDRNNIKIAVPRRDVMLTREGNKKDV